MDTFVLSDNTRKHIIFLQVITVLTGAINSQNLYKSEGKANHIRIMIDTLIYSI